MTDEQMISLLYLRDERALEELKSTYGELATSIAQRITGMMDSAEECVQDGLLDVWNSIPPQCPESLKYYFIRLVRNRALDSRRRQHRMKRGGGELSSALEELEHDIPSGSCVEDEISEKLLAERINVFLKKLPQRDRDVFLRRYYFMEPSASIASAMGLKRSNVNVILFRVRKQLKEFLIKEGLL